MTVIIDKKIRSERLHWEKVIDSGILEYVYIGQALKHLNSNDAFYKDAGYKSFKAYVEDRWPFTRQHAYKLIEASSVYTEMLNRKIERLPETYAWAEKLLDCADHIDDQIRVWTTTCDRSVKADKKITARLIEEVAQELFPQVEDQRPSITQSEVQEHRRVTPDEEDIVDAECEIKDPPENVELPNESQVEKTTPSSTVFTGTPSGGTSFIPEQFDPDMHEEPEVPTGKVPKHLEKVIVEGKEFRKILRDLSQIETRLLLLASTHAGSWMNAQEIERLVGQLKLEIKTRAYECNCPRCKNKPDMKCLRCGGRGFLDHDHAATLTDAEKAWVESHK